MRLTKTSDSFGGMVWFRSQDRNDLWLEPCEMTAHDSRRAIDELAAYEDAEEQGLLVRLPCKVGDMIYVIYDGKIWDGEVFHISYSDYYGKITATAWVKQGISASFEAFGKTVFLTRAEAEAALKGESKDV